MVQKINWHYFASFCTTDVIVFACIVEIAQYYRIVDVLHLRDNKMLSTVIGIYFDVKDILCYLIGTVILVIWEKVEKELKILT